ncbi:MAG: hypothetical protein ACI9WU_000052 [Myxococcota bacterium]|jgi:hypothetical protein
MRRLAFLLTTLCCFGCTDEPNVVTAAASGDGGDSASAQIAPSTDAPATDAPSTDPGAPPDDPDSEQAPCLASGQGQVTLHRTGTPDATISYAEPVTVSAQHLEPEGCLTRIALAWTRAAGCGLTLTFSPGTDGVWRLEHARLASGADCAAEALEGEAMGTLEGVPLVTSSSSPPLRCTALSDPIRAHGQIALGLDGDTLSLDSLALNGMLLSLAVDSGTCGQSYSPCSGQECGVDPLMGTSCGQCTGVATCQAGACLQLDPVEAMCQRVLDDRADLSEGQWSGDVQACQPGAMALDWQERALRQTNLYRWLVGQPPLVLDAAANPGLQECALMMHAGGALTHQPDSSWPCYAPAGAAGAGSSNIAGTPAVDAVDLYMVDPGNDTTIGHRRWILSDWISTTAFGSTNKYSCMRVIEGFGGGAGESWIAWPPPGYYPMDLHNVAYTTIDKTGWTIQVNAINLNGAVAHVTENGIDKPVDSVTLANNFGSAGALKITPAGWKMTVDADYVVTVAGASKPIEYSFRTVDCSP